MNIFRRAWQWWWRMNPGIEMADETAPPRLLGYYDNTAAPGWVVGQPNTAAPTPAEEKPLTAEEARLLLDADPCIYCGGYHTRGCGRVKRLAGNLPHEIQEVEYWQTWDTSTTIWRDELQAILDREEHDGSEA